ncbi:DHHC palmitoyltransferase-domain-containing protein [Corynascus novoguineensis]|uniref:Palmitoyltransferase PFA4 n=1 Tax=Corynascus novoguineensis TaxID=1126955 RepID=A0AAN7CQ92_9PEZI|nr:DHHC palmitoyltransferase-domain-containing protein [Corynascus novoguineensis]
MTSPKTGPATPGLHLLYIPSVCALIAFLGYFSQYLFNTDPDLAPGPLTRRETLTFNGLIVCVWLTYYRACTVDPGRYRFPREQRHDEIENKQPSHPLRPTRFCKKCAAPKPLRAHHCRHCGRCIPKMDHHCPWTGTCVSLQTFPHFLRFLIYANVALWYLGSLLWRRAAAVWADRRLPAYLGPSPRSLAGLTILALADAVTALALGLLLFTIVKGWVFNSTMIEDWEAERHEAVVARMGRSLAGEDEDERDYSSSSFFWGDADNDAAVRQALARIEFPYDLGFFANMAQAMGTRNVLRWFLPVFGGGPVINNETPGKGVGWEWEENGFNDLPGLWPPPDPEKIRQERRGAWPGAARQQQQQQQGGPWDGYQTQEEVKAAFARRQEEDLKRRQRTRALQAQQRSGIIAELEELEDDGERSDGYQVVGEPLWTNSEGDRLWDYGVDEEVEEEIIPAQADDEDVPLAELIRRRKVHTREDDG